MSDFDSGREVEIASVDLNADLGEGFPNDRALLAIVTSASICCGCHAGSSTIMRDVLRQAKICRVVVGAHPGYEDREGFGRREQNLTKNELRELIDTQLAALVALAKEIDARVAYVNPHGALYNQAQREPAVATAVVFAAQRFVLPVLGQPGSQLETAARNHGVRYFTEGFPDRRYGADGSLAPRSELDAVLGEPAEIESQVIRLVREGQVDTLCIHGDDPRSVANADLVRRVLETHDISVRAFTGGERRMGLLVIDPGLSTTVQDTGRSGYREWGVPVGGAFDRGSADLANALLGNESDCAVLELTLRGGTYEARGPLALALAGAPIDANILARDSATRVLQAPLCFRLRTGERLILGRTIAGARTYLAVRGGWQTRQTLGSRSSERRIRSGEIFPARFASTPTRHPGEQAWRSPNCDPLRIVDGPDSRLIAEAALTWANRELRVSSRSDRMGLRLAGEPILVDSPPNRLSTPVAPGAIQAAGGQLIVLGAACGTMGGYADVAQVISGNLDRLGQLAPGDMVCFRRVLIEEAREVYRLARASRRLQLSQLRMLAADTAAQVDET